jgi:hypothetical protein
MSSPSRATYVVCACLAVGTGASLFFFGCFSVAGTVFYITQHEYGLMWRALLSSVGSFILSAAGFYLSWLWFRKSCGGDRVPELRK